jgi:hypothetical protein
MIRVNSSIITPKTMSTIAAFLCLVAINKIVPMIDNSRPISIPNESGMILVYHPEDTAFQDKGEL